MVRGPLPVPQRSMRSQTPEEKGGVQKRPRSHRTDGACVEGIRWRPTRTGTWNASRPSSAHFTRTGHVPATMTCWEEDWAPQNARLLSQGRDLPEASDGGVARAGVHWGRAAGGGIRVSGGRAQCRAQVSPLEQHTPLYKGLLCGPRGTGCLLCSHLRT